MLVESEEEHGGRDNDHSPADSHQPGEETRDQADAKGNGELSRHVELGSPGQRVATEHHPKSGCNQDESERDPQAAGTHSVHHRSPDHGSDDPTDAYDQPHPEVDVTGQPVGDGPSGGDDDEGRKRGGMSAVLIESDPDQQRHQDDASPHPEESPQEPGRGANDAQLEEPYRHVPVHCDDVRTTVDWMEFTAGTALLVIDVQNDFADPGGSLYVSGGEQVIPFINEQIAAAVAGGATVVYSQDWHPGSTPHFAKDGGIWPVHCVADSPGAEFHADLDVIEDAIFIKTGVGGEDGYSAFNVRDPVTGEESPTGLEQKLEGLTTAVVLGLALDYCVKESALDAARVFEQTTVLADGTRAVDLEPGDGARAVVALVEAGVRVV